MNWTEKNKYMTSSIIKFHRIFTIAKKWWKELAVTKQVKLVINLEDGCNSVEKTYESDLVLLNVCSVYSKNNLIPESYRYLQKILSNFHSNLMFDTNSLPMTLIDMLVHYNIRI